MCEGGSGFLVREVVMRESWRVEWRDRKATILSDVAARAREAVERKRECVCVRVCVRV